MVKPRWGLYLREKPPMARKSNIARDNKRKGLVERFRERRQALKRSGDQEGLDKLPRNASPARLKNRCFRCGRSRAFMRDFGLCRACFRELANEGKVPGVRKSSW